LLLEVWGFVALSVMRADPEKTTKKTTDHEIKKLVAEANEALFKAVMDVINRDQFYIDSDTEQEVFPSRQRHRSELKAELRHNIAILFGRVSK
jgi:hypothetical protein